jgi:hypothetical protein
MSTPKPTRIKPKGAHGKRFSLWKATSWFVKIHKNRKSEPKRPLTRPKPASKTPRATLAARSPRAAP